MMNENNPIGLTEAVRRSAIGLAIFAFFTAGIITLTQTLTKDKIADNERAFEARTLLSLLPEGSAAEDILNHAASIEGSEFVQPELLNLEDDAQYYTLRDNSGAVETVILPVLAPEGYTEAIRLVTAINANGNLIGVRVTRHKETPGLGDQVELQKSEWIKVFSGKSLNNPGPDNWAVRKDGGEFDQLTGATITPRAIVKAVHQALIFFDLNKDTLLANQKSEQEAAS